jgi:hypothetical protein
MLKKPGIHHSMVAAAEDIQRPAQHTGKKGRGRFIHLDEIFTGDRKVAAYKYDGYYRIHQRIPFFNCPGAKEEVLPQATTKKYI